MFTTMPQRPSRNGALVLGQPRVASNPKPNQTGGLLTFGVSFLNDIPILWTVAIGITLIGTIYFLVAGRAKAFAPVTAPSPDDDLPAVSGGPGAAPQAGD